MQTFFASPERSASDEIEREHELFTAEKMFDILYSPLPEVLMILDHNRQVVYYNEALVSFLSRGSDLLGLRPGEVLSCIHACETPGGCGTSEACRTCGAVKAILAALDGNCAEEECRLTAGPSGAESSLDLRVAARPLEIGGKRFAVLLLNDISDMKRRHTLERIFFHDVINTAGSVMQLADFIVEHGAEKGTEILTVLGSASRRLVSEIMSQRELLAAENGDLNVKKESVWSHELLLSSSGAYNAFESGGEIVIDPAAEDFTLCTDPVLAGRVLGNMMKNAVEASARGHCVTATCEQSEGEAVFTVHNDSEIPREISLQIFQRSFSTKGIGRGIGTYSMKLLAERYLGGRVSFTTGPEAGTTFELRLPL